MKNGPKSILSVLLLWSLGASVFAQKVPYTIPPGKITVPTPPLHEGPPLQADVMAFTITPLITFEEYSAYLQSVRQDSGDAYYRSQFPDSNMCLPECYEAYINGDFHADPVVGISWENALNFCRWKTVRDNPGDSIEFVYRLPNLFEFRRAQDYLNEGGVAHDFSRYYAEWTINTKDESAFGLSQSDPYFWNYTYWAKPDDPPVLKRKEVAGSSFLYRVEDSYETRGFSYYQTEGYRHVGFRMVVDRFDMPREHERKPKDAEYLAKMWNLPVKKSLLK